MSARSPAISPAEPWCEPVRRISPESASPCSCSPECQGTPARLAHGLVDSHPGGEKLSGLARVIGAGDDEAAVMARRATLQPRVRRTDEMGFLVQFQGVGQSAGLAEEEVGVAPERPEVAAARHGVGSVEALGPQRVAHTRPERVRRGPFRRPVVHWQDRDHPVFSTLWRASAESRSLIPSIGATRRRRASSSWSRTPSARATFHNASMTCIRSS